MKETTQNADSTAMPVNVSPGQVTVESVLLPAFPRIVDEVERVPVKYGDKLEVLPIGTGETVSIDAFFFQSSTNFRLKKIKVALAGLKKAGAKDESGKEIDAVWFNDNVRDPFHKVLRFAAKHSLEHGRPVSLAFTRRTVKGTGESIVTAKHAFEHTVKGPKADAIVDKAAKAEKAAKQSKTRAKRQKRNKPLASVGEAMDKADDAKSNRIDALTANAVALGA